MPVRSSAEDLIIHVRQMIADAPGVNQFFLDQDIQDRLDNHRNDRRYEPLIIAPSIVNTPSTNNTPQTIFADYYSSWGWWESDATLQGTINGAPWVVLTPTSSDWIVGHWTFELDVFNSGTVPGQLPPIFISGKIHDLYAASADLLEFWAASLAGAYDVVVDGQSLRRSQMMTAKIAMAEYYRKQARPKLSKMIRGDVRAPVSSKKIRLLDDEDIYRGF